MLVTTKVHLKSSMHKDVLSCTYIDLQFLESTCCWEQVEEMENFLFSYSYLKKNCIPNDVGTLQNKSQPWARNFYVEFSSWRTMLTVLLEQHSDQSLFVIWFLYFLVASFPEMYFYNPEELISGMNDTAFWESEFSVSWKTT